MDTLQRSDTVILQTINSALYQLETSLYYYKIIFFILLIIIAVIVVVFLSSYFWYD